MSTIPYEQQKLYRNNFIITWEAGLMLCEPSISYDVYVAAIFIRPLAQTWAYQALAVVGPAPHTPRKRVTTSVSSLPHISSTLRNLPLLIISQTLDASFSPTPLMLRAT